MPDLREIEAGTTVITAVAVADVLEQPEEGIPLVTQLLMGWPAQVMGIEGDWFHIQAMDGSPGWAKVDHFCLPEWTEYKNLVQVCRATAGLTMEPKISGQRLCTLFLGSRLPLLEQSDEYLMVVLPQGGWAFVHRDEARIININQLVNKKEILAVAGLFSGAPYLWGGMTVRGIDCSGLTYIAYLANGYQLPRDAQDQFIVGMPVEKELEIGDLVFFSTIDPGPSHVGIYLGDGNFLNARTKEGVTVTSMEDPFFLSRYLGARRYK